MKPYKKMFSEAVTGKDYLNLFLKELHLPTSGPDHLDRSKTFTDEKTGTNVFFSREFVKEGSEKYWACTISIIITPTTYEKAKGLYDSYKKRLTQVAKEINSMNKVTAKVQTVKKYDDSKVLKGLLLKYKTFELKIYCTIE